jgi:hypothetical protein
MDDRESLADALSAQIFSYADLRNIEAYFERAGRADRRTAITLDIELSQDELKAFAQEVVGAAAEDESITANPVSDDGFAINVAYSELDHGATRFRQRREREANINITSEAGNTTLRLPATIKARAVADQFINFVEKTKKASIPREEIDLSSFADPDLRTKFFTTLITTLPDSKLNNVLRVRVEKLEKQTAAFKDDEENEDAKEEMLSLVKAVALNGESLLVSPEYQSLRKRGFFITSISWRVRKQPPSGPIVEYEAGFDEPQLCKAFRYAIGHWKTKYDTGEDRKLFTPIPSIQKDEYGKELEEIALNVLRELKKEVAKAEPVVADGVKQ